MRTWNITLGIAISGQKVTIVSTVGLNEATIKKYIQEQEAHDIAMDKVTEKEYQDPFKGSK